MGLYKNTNGVLSPIAGRGKAEYGASTVRTGTASIPQSSAGATNVVSVTFDKPMPDADYLVNFECSTSVIDLRLVSFDKTATGFKIGYYASAATGSASTAKYTAFKLYTDTEYNGLLNSQRYSTSEIDTGKTWIEGKKIYRKVVDLGTLPNATTKDVSHGISNVSAFVDVRGMAVNTTSGIVTLPIPRVATANTMNLDVSLNATNIHLDTSFDYSGWTGFVILEYTKS